MRWATVSQSRPNVAYDKILDPWSVHNILTRLVANSPADKRTV